MAAQWVQRDSDVAYRIPQPEVFGFAFAHASDPSGASRISAVLLRDGLVYLMRFNATTRRYELESETRGSATGLAGSVSGYATGVPLAVFLDEMNFRWRAWASANINDLTNAGGAAFGGPVWNGAGQYLSTLQAAATAWKWEPL